MDMQKVMQDNAAVYRTQSTLEEVPLFLFHSNLETILNLAITQGKRLIDETVKSFKDVKVSIDCEASS
jgi:hypothetical protein